MTYRAWKLQCSELILKDIGDH